MNQYKILFIAGTRPEVIKIAPVVRLAKKKFHTSLVLTGQHGEMARQMLKSFDLEADKELLLSRESGSLAELSAQLMVKLDELLTEEAPDLVLVQGDTSTVTIAGLAAFYQRIPVAHIEAGLRSGDKEHPFPEEVNRKIVSTFADLNFAPTHHAANNLKQEGAQPTSIVVTGNTVVDSIQLIESSLPEGSPKEHVKILVTTHRRENWDNGIQNICNAILRIIDHLPDVEVIFPVHKNPIVGEQVQKLLSDIPNIKLIPPMEYIELQACMRNCSLILTDSGGIQEEAPSHGVPVLVLRKVTERPEAVTAGQAIIVGTETKHIVGNAIRILSDTNTYNKMATIANPFGDGKASERIVKAIERFLSKETPYLSKDEQFPL